MKKFILGIIIGFILLFLVIHNGVGITIEQIGFKIQSFGSTVRRFEKRLNDGGKDRLGKLKDLINRDENKK
ncbi:MAG: hypothetical protein ACE5IH_04695 [Thermodesulfobacteriota bacterium]